MSAEAIALAAQVVESTNPAWKAVMNGVYVYAEHCARHRRLSPQKTMQEGMRYLLSELAYEIIYGGPSERYPIDYKREHARDVVDELKEYALLNPRKES